MKTGRNEPCHCGSEKKYKKCCLSKDQSGKTWSLSKIFSGKGLKKKTS